LARTYTTETSIDDYRKDFIYREAVSRAASSNHAELGQVQIIFGDRSRIDFFTLPWRSWTAPPGSGANRPLRSVVGDRDLGAALLLADGRGRVCNAAEPSAADRKHPGTL
jgi:hypothetical protein